MVQKLEMIKGGGGSIKIGTTGTVATLMTRELDSMKASPQTPNSRSNRTIPVSVDCVSTPKRVQSRKSSDEASSSNSLNHVRTPKGYPKTTHNLPMLRSDNVSLNGSPRREKKSNIVEIVDVKCGNPDRAWASPITNKLKKLGFSKLSESIM